MENDSVEYIYLHSSFMMLQGTITASGFIACESGTHIHQAAVSKFSLMVLFLLCITHRD